MTILKRILFMSSDKKNEIKLRKTEKTLKKESNSNESDFSGN